MNKKANEIYKKIVVNNKFKELVKKYRQLLNIPPKGITESNIFKFQKSLGDISEEDEMMIGHHELKFFEEVKKSLIKIWDIDREWNDVLRDYLYQGKTNQLDSVNMTGCSISAETENEAEDYGPDYTGKMSINIGLHSTTSDIINFVKKNARFIKMTQDFLSTETRALKKPRIRQSKNSRRDYMIYKLNKKSMRELEKLGGSKGYFPGTEHTTTYKALKIANIMESMGYKVTDDNVRKIISRQNKLIEE